MIQIPPRPHHRIRKVPLKRPHHARLVDDQLVDPDAARRLGVPQCFGDDVAALFADEEEEGGKAVSIGASFVGVGAGRAGNGVKGRVMLQDEVGQGVAVAGVCAVDGGVGEVGVSEGGEGARGGGSDGVEGEGGGGGGGD